MIDVYSARKWLLLSLILSGSEAMTGLVPKLDLNVTQLQLNEGDLLEFTCTHTREVHVVFPITNYPRRSKTSTHELIHKERRGPLVEKTFRRVETVFGDTGLYGCMDVLAFKTMPTAHDTLSVDQKFSSLIYVYVRSNSSAFTETRNQSRTIYKHPGEPSVTLPCRPTDPNVNITVFDEVKKEIVQALNNDPELGLTVISSSSNLSCLARLDGRNDSISYEIAELPEQSYFRSDSLGILLESSRYNDPIMRKPVNQAQVKFHNQLKINCTIETRAEVNVTVHLSGPAYFAGRNTWSQREVRRGNGWKTTYYEVIFMFFTGNDVGLYECTFLMDREKAGVVTYINGYNGTLKIADSRHDSQFVDGDTVELCCEDSSLKADSSYYYSVVWLDAETMETLNDTNDDSMTRSYAKFKVICTNETLEVERRLVCCLKKVNLQVHADAQIVSEFYYNFMFKKRVPLEFVETNLDNKMTIYQNQRSVNQSLKCYARSVPAVTNVTWKKDGREIDTSLADYVPNTDNQELLVRDLSDKISNYSCRVVNRFNEIIEAHQVLATHDRLETRFNGTTNLKNATTLVQRRLSVNLPLKCYAEGEPKPNVTWYKDGVNVGSINKENQDFGEEVFAEDSDKQELLVISLPVHSDEVTYSCKAVNNYGEEVKLYQILKVDPPFWENYYYVILFVVVIAVIVIANAVILKIRGRKVKEKYLQKVGLLEFKQNLSTQLNSQELIYSQVNKLPYEKKWEFNKKRLKLGEQLGSGAYGIVVKAEAYGISPGEEVTTVAVKMVHPYADSVQIRALASELKIMIYIGKHINVLNLLGACTDNISKRELYVIVEYCQHGNLHEHILKNRGSFADANEASSSQNAIFSVQDLVSWSFQVARGMEYLSQKKVIHGDLAARNLLLCENSVVKICDFGLSNMLYRDNGYTRKTHGLLPVKWMSIESIRDGVFSTQSDVWSYGIVLWELFSLAKIPYSNIRSENILTRLLDGYRLKKPKYASEIVYEVMTDCWNEDPSSRPTFGSLVEQISRILEVSVKTYYTELSSMRNETEADCGEEA